MIDEMLAGRRAFRADSPGPTGVTLVGRAVVAANGSRYAYSFVMQLSDLYVVAGLK